LSGNGEVNTPGILGNGVFFCMVRSILVETPRNNRRSFFNGIRATQQYTSCVFCVVRAEGTHPQALGSFFVASYDSQGYGGGIRRPRLHTGPQKVELLKNFTDVYEMKGKKTGFKAKEFWRKHGNGSPHLLFPGFQSGVH
jgi:hypothetical protein